MPRQIYQGLSSHTIVSIIQQTKQATGDGLCGRGEIGAGGKKQARFAARQLDACGPVPPVHHDAYSDSLSASNHHDVDVDPLMEIFCS